MFLVQEQNQSKTHKAKKKGCSDEFVNTAFSVYSASGILIKKNVNVQYIWREFSWKCCFRKYSQVQKIILHFACILYVHSPGFQSTARVPEGLLIYWVLVMAENHLVNVIVDSKGNGYLNCFSERIKRIIKLFFRLLFNYMGSTFYLEPLEFFVFVCVNIQYDFN